MLLLGAPLLYAGEPAPAPAANQQPTLAERLASLEQLDAGDWGIRNGCILLSRVRQMTFIDDQTAQLTLTGNRQAVLRLARECPGIASSGYVLINRSGRLCARFDAVAVLDSRLGGARAGLRCQIESIAPQLALDRYEP